jgi:2,3-bisphosphoglycerate-dependent phosphoglycerate mutase
MKFYFVRHGESEANTRHIISNRASPFALTLLGREQAHALARSLSDVPVRAIFSSPIRRASETAEILAASFNQTYHVTEALREYDCGVLEEKSDTESWKLHSEIAEDWVWRHNHSRRPEGGESFLDIRNRFVPFIEHLTRDGSNRHDHILLVGHGGLFHLMLPLILTNVDVSFVKSHGMGHTETVLAEQRPNGLTCLQWGAFKFETSVSTQMS